MNHLIYFLDCRCCYLLRIMGIKCKWTSETSVIYRLTYRMFKKKAYFYSQKRQLYQTVPYIWVFWWQGVKNMPTVVKNCYNQLQKQRGEHEVILLDEFNFAKYVSIPDFILEKVHERKITLTHFSDVLRFYLLSQYGGWWIDVTIFTCQEIKLENRPYTVMQPHSNRYISEGKWASFLWYLPPNHPFANYMKDCLTDYWTFHDKIITYLFMDYLIRLFYEISSPFAKEIDSLQIESPQLYFFQDKASMADYEPVEWQRLISQNRFMKCNRRLNSNEIRNCYPHSFIHELLCQ